VRILYRSYTRPLVLHCVDSALILSRMGTRSLSGTGRYTCRPVHRATAIFMLGAAGCAAPPAPGEAGSLPRPPIATVPTATPEEATELRVGRALTLREVSVLRQNRDFFTLRERLEETGGDGTLPVLAARAVVSNGFNDASGTNDAIAAALAHPDLPDTLELALREIQMANHLRRHDYARALAAADSLIERHEGQAGAGPPEDIQNVRKLLAALVGAPPQTVRAAGPSTFTFVNGRIPVAFGDFTRDYWFDTGANLSIIMRSEAEALGLDIRPAGIDMATSTDTRVVGDVALASSLRIGAMEFRDVAFVVVDDAVLTFGDFRIPGVIGFPVIEAMGEIRLRPDGEALVPGSPQSRSVRNLALDVLTPLTTVGWEGEALICRLDTGADHSIFYEPFFRRFRTVLEKIGTPTTRRIGGIGGERDLPVLELPRAVLAVGDTTATIQTVDVLTVRITRMESENYLDCNIGRDVLDQFTEYILNFRDMAFLLR
jgi:hypothetical protein